MTAWWVETVQSMTLRMAQEVVVVPGHHSIPAPTIAALEEMVDSMVEEQVPDLRKMAGPQVGLALRDSSF